jgi:hypothetical protein
MNNVQTPAAGLPGLRKLTPPEQSQRAAAFVSSFPYCVVKWRVDNWDATAQFESSQILLPVVFRRRTMEILISSISRSLKICLLLCTLATSSCKNNDTPKSQDESGMGSIVGVNYTENGIQEFTVDGVWGSNIGAYGGGGGFVCCVIYPKAWAPGFSLKVKWRRSAEREANGTQWRIISLERLVYVEKYEIEGNVYVLFLPGDEVKVYISAVGVGSPKFPSNPGYPEDAKR